jgi:hypothetical protein
MGQKNRVNFPKEIHPAPLSNQPEKSSVQFSSVI